MNTGPGYKVETQNGEIGRTYHNKGLINGKIPVYIEGVDTPILCKQSSLKLKGFID